MPKKKKESKNLAQDEKERSGMMSLQKRRKRPLMKKSPRRQ
jgi:hypothetical protein